MKNRTTQFTSLLAAAIFMLFAVSCNSDKTKAAEASNEPPSSVSAVKLLADYEADEAAADKQYKGKTLIVSGEVLSVTAKHDGTSEVLINSPESSIGAVRCLFAADQATATSKLAREQQTTIKGVCEGFDVIQVVIGGSTIEGAAQ
jgi:hypothetical protein